MSEAGSECARALYADGTIRKHVSRPTGRLSTHQPHTSLAFTLILHVRQHNHKSKRAHRSRRRWDVRKSHVHKSGKPSLAQPKKTVQEVPNE